MLNLKPMAWLAIPLLLLTLTACAGQKPLPQIERILVYPDLPQTSCASEPAPPPSAASDKQIVSYFEAVRLAGADCRARLKAIHDAATKWSRNSKAGL
jgi:hypothetical protein